LSRLVRANPEIRAMIPELSVVSPAKGGLPVAYGVCEALRAKKVYWAERESEDKPLRFRQFIEPEKGEQVLLVDDILRSGSHLDELKALVESYGAVVVAVAVIIYQPAPYTRTFGTLPLLHLARLDAAYYADSSICNLCQRALPSVKVWV
jgi:orotate phosphoribosyltransferase